MQVQFGKAGRGGPGSNWAWHQLSTAFGLATDSLVQAPAWDCLQHSSSGTIQLQHCARRKPSLFVWSVFSILIMMVRFFLGEKSEELSSGICNSNCFACYGNAHFYALLQNHWSLPGEINSVCSIFSHSTTLLLKPSAKVMQKTCPWPWKPWAMQESQPVSNASWSFCQHFPQLQLHYQTEFMLMLCWP